MERGEGSKETKWALARAAQRVCGAGAGDWLEGCLAGCQWVASRWFRGLLRACSGPG